MEIAGYFGAILIGVVLGLIGGGGSILAVPILLYLFYVPSATLATAYSLFIVGVTASIGAIQYMRKQQISYKTAIIFGIPSVISVFLTRKYIIEALPENLFEVGDIIITKDIGIIALFSLLMIAASFSMIKKRKIDQLEGSEEQKFNYPLILIEGAVVGVLTGLVGSGGGFLIIPALVILSRLPMKMAVGTSLLIIAVKSLIGFTGDLSNAMAIDWSLLGWFTGLSIIGILLGSYLSNFISGAKLKPAFGWFTLLMGVYMIVDKIVKLN